MASYSVGKVTDMACGESWGAWKVHNEDAQLPRSGEGCKWLGLSSTTTMPQMQSQQGDGKTLCW